MNINELYQLQGLPLEIKILKSQQRIKEWYEKYNGEVYISFSGGKDSTVLLYLVRELYPNVKALFIDTGLEYPEILEFVKTIENVEIRKPKKSFASVIKEYGVPIISKNIAQGFDRVRNTKDPEQVQLRLYGGINPTSNKKQYPKIPKKWHYLLNEDIKISDRCCYHIKKQPIYKFNKETKLMAFVGTMADESQTRKLTYIKQGGCNYYGHYSQPIGFWTTQDILNYLFKTKKPYSKCYGDIVKTEINSKIQFVTLGEDRTGCMGCMFGINREKGENRFQRMKRTHPKHYNYFINGLGFGKYLDLINVKYE